MSATISSDSNLPLTPAVFHVLLALVDGEKHGYGIMKLVETDTAGQVNMGPGTLYGTINRLLKKDWIEETDARPDPELDDKRRKYYQLTPTGKAILNAEIDRLQAMVTIAEQRRRYST